MIFPIIIFCDCHKSPFDGPVELNWSLETVWDWLLVLPMAAVFGLSMFAVAASWFGTWRYFV